MPVTGHQGPGTLTDELIRTVLQLQGTMHPHQVISLEDLPGETSFALPDHYDHVHVGYQPEAGVFGEQFNAMLKPDQWQRLTHRLERDREPGSADRPLEVLAAGQAQAARRRRPAAPKAATDPSGDRGL